MSNNLFATTLLATAMTVIYIKFIDSNKSTFAWRKNAFKVYLTRLEIPCDIWKTFIGHKSSLMSSKLMFGDFI